MENEYKITKIRRLRHMSRFCGKPWVRVYFQILDKTKTYSTDTSLNETFKDSWEKVNRRVQQEVNSIYTNQDKDFTNQFIGLFNRGQLR